MITGEPESCQNQQKRHGNRKKGKENPETWLEPWQLNYRIHRLYCQNYEFD